MRTYRSSLVLALALVLGASGCAGPSEDVAAAAGDAVATALYGAPQPPVISVRDLPALPGDSGAVVVLTVELRGLAVTVLSSAAVAARVQDTIPAVLAARDGTLLGARYLYAEPMLRYAHGTYLRERLVVAGLEVRHTGRLVPEVVAAPDSTP